MKCPYCGKEMSEGYLYNGKQPNQWLPRGITDKGITLKNKFSFFRESGYSAEAFYCYQCRIVIAPAE